MKNRIDFLKKRFTAKNICFFAVGLLLLLLILSSILYLKTETFYIHTYVEMIAGVVTFVSIIFLCLQVLLFISDYKHRNLRLQKEYALELANRYADDILENISFLVSVMNTCLGNDDINSLCNNSKDKLKLFTKEESEKIISEKILSFYSIETTTLNIEMIKRSFTLHPEIYKNFRIIEEKIPEEKEIEYYIFFYFGIMDDTLNKLEAFAMALNENVAEELLLYPSLHQTFLKAVKLFYPRFVKRNHSSCHKYYTNIIKLFNLWEDRSNKENERDKHLYNNTVEL